MSRRLEGKIALITGGSSGIGLATAKRYVEEGAFVYILGRRQEELDNAIAELGPQAVGVQGDVAKNADLDRLYAKIAEEKGRLDIVFANAGGGEFASLAEITEEHFDKWFGINVKGLVFTVQKALPLLSAGGSVILTASVVASKGFANFGVYSATKAAVRSFARTWTQEWRGRDIRVNVISPGPIRTPILSTISKGHEEEFLAAVSKEIPLGRVGEPVEIANAAVFLGSSESSFVAGAELCVDGGLAQV